MTPELAAQSLWSLVPVTSRARYLRRAAIAVLDELDELAGLLAEQTGWPRGHVVTFELLPSVRGLHALADEGPRALADRRLAPRALWAVGRSTRLVQSPVGVVGLRGPSASPWAEPLLETAASLLAGNAVVLTDGPAAGRLRAALLRAGVPGELVAVVPAGAQEGGDDADGPGIGAGGDTGVDRPGARARRDAGVSRDLDAACRRVIDLPRPNRLGTLLVLEGAPREQVVEAALWAAFGGHAAAAGRLVLVEGAVSGLVAALEQGAAQLEEAIGPPEIVAVEPDDPRFVDPPQRALLAVVEVPDADTAVRVASRDGRGGAISVWARDPAKGERVARRLPATTTWVGHHGVAPTIVMTRIARHVVPRQLEWRAPWAPAFPRDVATRTALAELRHGRQSRRWPALRALAQASRRKR